MILLNTIIHSRQLVKGQTRLFWTYNEPYSFISKNITLSDSTVVSGGGAQLAGFWEAMTTAVFGLIGIETVAITAAENKDLRTEETVKIATRKISMRLLILYALATFTVRLNICYLKRNMLISKGWFECALHLSNNYRPSRHFVRFRPKLGENIGRTPQNIILKHTLTCIVCRLSSSLPFSTDYGTGHS